MPSSLHLPSWTDPSHVRARIPPVCPGGFFPARATGHRPRGGSPPASDGGRYQIRRLTRRDTRPNGSSRNAESVTHIVARRGVPTACFSCSRSTPENALRQPSCRRQLALIESLLGKDLQAYERGHHFPGLSRSVNPVPAERHPSCLAHADLQPLTPGRT